MNKKWFLTFGCMAIIGLMFINGCSNGKSLNPVEPAADESAKTSASLTTTDVFSGPYDTVEVMSQGLLHKIVHVKHTGFRSTHPIYADTQSQILQTYPAPPTSAHRDLTCPQKPGYTLTIGFTAGQISYIVEKYHGTNLVMFCTYIDSYYQSYDGSYIHRITQY